MLSLILASAYSIDSYEEASIMADKVTDALTNGWAVETGPISDISYFKLMREDQVMQCCNADCVEGTAEQVLNKWIPFIGLYSKENFISQSVVTQFGANWVQYKYRHRYRTNENDPFKELLADAVFYINNDGLINQIHHMFDPKSWETFLNTAQKEADRKRKSKTDL